MSATTSIEWTDRTWNPVTGCTKVSAGCDHCYAETLHERFHGKGSFADVITHRDKITAPLRWRKPAKVFVNSMSDLFHKDVTDVTIARIWATMALAPQHTFQVLTKRHARMQSLLSAPDWLDAVYDAGVGYIGLNSDARDALSRTLKAAPLPNVWLGVSVEDQRWADIRIPALIGTPAAVRWISAEPLLGPVDLRFVDVSDDDCTCGGMPYGHQPGCGTEPGPHWGIDWVVAGGESGPGARPMHPAWVRALRDECARVNVPFLFKQWGAHDEHGRRVGKKRAGRELDGRIHDDYPEARS